MRRRECHPLTRTNHALRTIIRTRTSLAKPAIVRVPPIVAATIEVLAVRILPAEIRSRTVRAAGLTRLIETHALLIEQAAAGKPLCRTAASREPAAKRAALCAEHRPTEQIERRHTGTCGSPQRATLPGAREYAALQSRTKGAARPTERTGVAEQRLCVCTGDADTCNSKKQDRELSTELRQQTERHGRFPGNGVEMRSERLRAQERPFSIPRRPFPAMLFYQHYGDRPSAIPIGRNRI